MTNITNNLIKVNTNQINLTSLLRIVQQNKNENLELLRRIPFSLPLTPRFTKQSHR